jgi:TonB family protein
VDYLILVRSMRSVLIFTSVLFAVVTSSFGQTANVDKPSGGSAVYATYTVKPEYPYFARSRHMHGSGIFQLHIRADGTVSSVDTIQSTGYFELDEVSIGAFSKWRFRAPGRPTKVKLPINFSLSHGGFPRPPLPPPPNRGKVREVHEDLTNR